MYLPAGTIVHLKSGSPDLRVVGPVENAVMVEWPTENPTHWDTFPSVCLVIPRPGEGQEFPKHDPSIPPASRELSAESSELGKNCTTQSTPPEPPADSPTF